MESGLSRDLVRKVRREDAIYSSIITASHNIGVIFNGLYFQRALARAPACDHQLNVTLMEIRLSITTITNTLHYINDLYKSILTPISH